MKRLFCTFWLRDMHLYFNFLYNTIAKLHISSQFHVFSTSSLINLRAHFKNRSLSLWTRPEIQFRAKVNLAVFITNRCFESMKNTCIRVFTTVLELHFTQYFGSIKIKQPLGCNVSRSWCFHICFVCSSNRRGSLCIMYSLMRRMLCSYPLLVCCKSVVTSISKTSLTKYFRWSMHNAWSVYSQMFQSHEKRSWQRPPGCSPF